MKKVFIILVGIAIILCVVLMVLIYIPTPHSPIKNPIEFAETSDRIP